MRRFAMIATESNDKYGYVFEPGDRFDAPPLHARMLLYRKLARIATPADDPPPSPPEPESEPEPIAAKPVRRRRRSYKTRDMRAE